MSAAQAPPPERGAAYLGVSWNALPSLAPQVQGSPWILRRCFGWGKPGGYPSGNREGILGGNFIPFILFRWTPTNLLRPEEMCCHPWTYIPPTPRWVVISKCLPESGFSEME